MRKLIIGVPVIFLFFAVALGTYWLTNSSEPTVVKDSGGTSEGIKVHGDWEVRVTDQNSGEEKFYAFSNALHPMTGNSVLLFALNDGIEFIDPSLTPVAQPWDYGGSDSLALHMMHDSSIFCDNPLVSGQHFIYENSKVPEFPSALTVYATCIVPADITSVDAVLITNIGMSMWGITEKTGLNISVSPGQVIAASVVISFQ